METNKQPSWVEVADKLTKAGYSLYPSPDGRGNSIAKTPKKDHVGKDPKPLLTITPNAEEAPDDFDVRFAEEVDNFLQEAEK